MQEAAETVHEAHRVIAKVRKAHLRPMRELELDKGVESFNGYVRRHGDAERGDRIRQSRANAKRAIERNDPSSITT